MKDKVRIGNAGGFWGDDLDAFRRQLEDGELDYVSLDFLAEITMSILRKQRLKNPAAGFVPDFVAQVVENATLLRRRGARVVTSAGGINPLGCARRIVEELNRVEQPLRVAVIEGDDLMDRLAELYPGHTELCNLETGESFAGIRDRLQSANVYLGVGPVLKALETGAEVVVAGRVTDTAITMGPMIHEFGWALDDWDRLAAGLVAGHIIECGAQATGGNFTDWRKVPSWDRMGYPIVEAYSDGSFVVTKHPGTGGLVSVDTVREQLVYEMGDPACYISPDVVADFTTIRLAADGPDRVRVWGIRGRPATPTFKVSMAYADGFKASAGIIVGGEEALAKARLLADIFWRRLGTRFERTHTEYVGYNAGLGGLAPPIQPNEILLRFHAYDHDPARLEAFAKSIAPLILSGPPGVAVTGGRPSAQEVVAYYPTLIPKSLVTCRVSLLDNQGRIERQVEVAGQTGFEEELSSPGGVANFGEPAWADPAGGSAGPGEVAWTGETERVPLQRLCLARSGDKGDTANIGVVARSEAAYRFLKARLTAEAVREMFRGLCRGRVRRYALDNLLALNFLLEESLDGGGTRSLMIDAQGKLFASGLLGQSMEVPRQVLESVVMDADPPI